MIYFVKQLDYVKIGYTSRIKTRISELQISSPVKIDVIGLIEGEKEHEQEMHKKFSHINTNGEWFMYCDEIKSFIDSLDKKLMWEYGFIESDSSQIGLIKRIRLEKNMSLDELGNILNMTKQAVLDMERRDMQGRITIGTLYKALKAMGYKYEARAVQCVS